MGSHTEAASEPHFRPTVGVRACTRTPKPSEGAGNERTQPHIAVSPQENDGHASRKGHGSSDTPGSTNARSAQLDAFEDAQAGTSDFGVSWTTTGAASRSVGTATEAFEALGHDSLLPAALSRNG